jgi:hypothetical protein
MKLAIEEYFRLQHQILHYFHQDDTWDPCALVDYTNMFWYVFNFENGRIVVRYSGSKPTSSKGHRFEAQVFEAPYRAEAFTLIPMNLTVNKVLGIFSNDREQTDHESVHV